MEKGYFVISLDFELRYGILDWTEEHYQRYKNNLAGVKTVIPRMLELFQKYEIAATWAAVGMLFHKDKDDLMEHLPDKKPGYIDQNFSTYAHLDKITPGHDDEFFGGKWIPMIASCPGQELGCHTYSHYYCGEPGQTVEEFEEDVKQAIKVMQDCGYKRPVSFVFPRNMCNSMYLDVLRRNGILCYRGNSDTWVRKIPKKYKWLRKGCRFLDGCLSLTGHQCYDLQPGAPVNIQDSRYLYPSVQNAAVEKMRLHRIKRQMRYAAKHKKVFHLWWHPHNFGVNTETNLKKLEEILKYYRLLSEKYDFESANMGMLAEKYCTSDRRIRV